LVTPKGASFLLNPTLGEESTALLVLRSFQLKKEPLRGEDTPLNTCEGTTYLMEPKWYI